MTTFEEEIKKRIAASAAINKEKIEEAGDRSHVITANVKRNEAIQEIGLRNPIVREILNHHSAYPFQSIHMECKESQEAKNLYLEILQTIEFGTHLTDIVKELMKVGETIMVFEGQWGPPKFLNPTEVEVLLQKNSIGQIEEQLHYKVDPEIRDLVLNTPPQNRDSLLKIMDSYSIRQIQLGRDLNLTYSPAVKVIHTRRMTAEQPQAYRGVSYFDPIINKLIEGEVLRDNLVKGTEKDYSKAIRKIREIDKLTFEFAFPYNLKLLEAEMRYLQDIIKHMLIEEVFKPAAMKRNFFNDKGLIVPELEFQHLDLENDANLQAYMTNLRRTSGIDTQTTIEEFLKLHHQQRP